MATAATALSRHQVVDGVRLHYLDWGNAGAQPLVLLHGFTSHAHSWDAFAEAVSPAFHVIALDQRGHGDSEWTRRYGTEVMVGDLDGFVRELGLQQFVLLGLSMGGSNAFNYAVLHPDEVERLVIVDIGPQIETSGSDRIQTGVQAPDVFDSKEEAFAQARIANSRPPEDIHRERVYNGLMPTLDGKWTWKYDRALRGADGARVRPRIPAEVSWERWRAIQCPTLLVRGALSDILAESTAQRMVDENKNCELVTIADSGHSIPLDQPVAFEAAVKAWLAK